MLPLTISPSRNQKYLRVTITQEQGQECQNSIPQGQAHPVGGLLSPKCHGALRTLPSVALFLGPGLSSSGEETRRGRGDSYRLGRMRSPAAGPWHTCQARSPELYWCAISSGPLIRSTALPAPFSRQLHVFTRLPRVAAKRPGPKHEVVPSPHPPPAPLPQHLQQGLWHSEGSRMVRIVPFFFLGLLHVLYYMLIFYC